MFRTNKEHPLTGVNWENELLPHSSRWPTFTLDRRDDAVAFARANAAGPSARAGEQVVEHAAHVDLAAWDFPDTRADDLRRCFAAVENALRFTEMHRFGRRFLKAYGDMGALIDEIGAGDPDPGLLSQAVEANRRVVDAADPAWAKHEPVIMDAVGILRGVEMRRVFEAERALSHDADALAGFSP